jgi:DNA repair exonuclease SbcCD nuclease subunit
MTVLVTADLHMSDNTRDSYRFVFMDWLIAAVRKRKDITLVIILGDLTDDKDRHSAFLTNKVADYIRLIADEYDVIVLKGNHDYLIEDSPFFQFLGHIPNVRWMNKPTRIYVEEIGRCLFLPHTKDYKKEWESELSNKFKLVLCHQTFEGANIGTRRLEGIPLSIFPKGVRIISGDIHVPQTIGPLTYVGAPYHVDFGDNYDSRVLLIDGDKITSLPYTGPQKRLIELTSLSESNIAKQAEKAGARKGDLVKFRINLKTDEYDRWGETKDGIKLWAEKRGYAVETVQPVVDMRPGTYRKTDARTDTEIVAAFGKRANVPKETLNTGIKLLES